MSATNRGGTRRDADYYPTPAWCVDRLLEAVDLPRGEWLEPCAGDGAIMRAVDAQDWDDHHDMVWTTVDIREESGADIIADYLWMGCPELGDKRFDVAITNPPFGHAEEFVHASLARADIVVMLLRLSWLASERRAPFMRQNPPSVYVLPNRPSFTGDGSTDAADYGWFIWGLGGPPRLHVLRSTPPEERRP